MIRNKKGSSMVSVIVAFLLLMIILTIFWQSVKLANSLVSRSEDMRRDSTELIGNYYQYRSTASGTENSYNFGNAFNMTIKWNSYSDDKGTIYYFGDGSSVNVVPDGGTE